MRMKKRTVANNATVLFVLLVINIHFIQKLVLTIVLLVPTEQIAFVSQNIHIARRCIERSEH